MAHKRESRASSARCSRRRGASRARINNNSSSSNSSLKRRRLRSRPGKVRSFRGVHDWAVNMFDQQLVPRASPERRRGPASAGLGGRGRAEPAGRARVRALRPGHLCAPARGRGELHKSLGMGPRARGERRAPCTTRTLPARPWLGALARLPRSRARSPRRCRACATRGTRRQWSTTPTPRAQLCLSPPTPPLPPSHHTRRGSGAPTPATWRRCRRT